MVSSVQRARLVFHCDIDSCNLPVIIVNLFCLFNSQRSPIRFFFSKDPPKTTRKSAVDNRRENSLRMIKEELEKRGQHMDQRSKEYKIGMRHLANMMNEDPITFTQEDADVRHTFRSFCITTSPAPILLHCH